MTTTQMQLADTRRYFAGPACRAIGRKSAVPAVIDAYADAYIHAYTVAKLENGLEVKPVATWVPDAELQAAHDAESWPSLEQLMAMEPPEWLDQDSVQTVLTV